MIINDSFKNLFVNVIQSTSTWNSTHPVERWWILRSCPTSRHKLEPPLDWRDFRRRIPNPDDRTSFPHHCTRVVGEVSPFLSSPICSVLCRRSRLQKIFNDNEESKPQQIADLHHVEFLRISEVTTGRIVVENFSVDEDVRPVYQPLLNILQHLRTNLLEGMKFLNICREIIT